MFDESVFPFCSCSSTTTITSAPQIEHIPVPVFENSYDIVTEDASENENEDLTDTNTGSDSDTLEDSNVDLPAQPPIGSSHTMVTRAKDGIVKPKHLPDFITNYFVPHPIHTAFTSIVSLSKEPKTYKSASKHDEWIASMQKEHEALMLNNTWSLVAPTSDMNILGSKWIYKLKLNPDGTIDRFKSRLVAQGCSQQDEIDYNATFSPVVKTTTIRVVLTIALSNKWSIRQLDVSNAFLHRDLTEKVYVKQPEGFEDPQHPDHVCLLHKSIYGLKQAPRAWFEKFSGFLLDAGFVMAVAYPSMFIYHCGNETAVLLLYVDDNILTGSSDFFLNSLINQMSSQFAMKDMGDLCYVLGIEAVFSSSRDIITLTQKKYTIDLLVKAKMIDCKPCFTPTSTDKRASIHDGDLLTNPLAFRSLVGGLQYLTLTRTDITFAVNYISQFMHSPTTVHMPLAKRVLRYLKGTLGSDTVIQSCDTSSITSFSDSDWAGYPDTRRSTSGYCVFLGTTLVSWSSKKQPTVSRSSAEAEYKALSVLAAEVVWLSSLLEELHITPTTPFVMHCDNLGAQFLASNPAFHARTKHIEVDYHFVRDLMDAGTVVVRFVPSSHQLDDLFTKGLAPTTFFRLEGEC